MQIICKVASQSEVPPMQDNRYDFDDKADERTNKALDEAVKRLEREYLEERHEKVAQV